MTTLRTFRVVFAQSILTEFIVKAADYAAAEDAADDLYQEPGTRLRLRKNQWVGDSYEVCACEELPDA
jgi:hypothetical protein